MEYQIAEIIQESPNVRRFLLRAENPFEEPFKAGQFIVLQAEIDPFGMVQRSYSIASITPDTQYFELCIVKKEDGQFSPWLFEQTVGTWIVGSEPQGSFVFDASFERQKHVFIATGTGVAPFRSMIHEALKLQETPVYLIFGNRFSADILYHQYWLQLEKDNELFHYHPVLSREEQSFAHYGYVHPVYQKILEQTSEAQVYVCGWKDMLQEARRNLKQLGFNRKQYHFEQYD